MKNKPELEDKKIYMCNICGVSLTNRSTWCDLGCGSDYNKMIEIKGLPGLISLAKKQSYDDGYEKGWEAHKKAMIGQLTNKNNG